jgi:hypothetical protein
MPYYNPVNAHTVVKNLPPPPPPQKIRVIV